MSAPKGFTIEIGSRFEGWWRYNAVLMCGCFDADGNRTDFAAAESHVADVGNGPKERPALLPPDRSLRLDAPECHHLVLYIYLVPHTLPQSNDIETTKPFALDLKIDCDGSRIRTERLAVNQWAGLSLELRVDRP